MLTNNEVPILCKYVRTKTPHQKNLPLILLHVIDVVAVELFLTAWDYICFQKNQYNQKKKKKDYPKRHREIVKDLSMICFSVKPSYGLTTEKGCRFFGMLQISKHR